MEFSRLKHGNMMTLILSGRLDAAGAAELDIFVEHSVGEDPCRNYIFDMNGVSYLSSAGLRIFTLLAKKLAAEQGTLALFGLQSFCLEVLNITGLDKVLKIFPSQLEAEQSCQLQQRVTNAAVATGARGEVVESPAGSYEFIALSEASARLRVFGDINNVLHSQLASTVVHGSKFCDIRDSLGFGALGGVPSEYLPAIGHMLTFDGRLFWTPANTSVADYLFPDAANLDKSLLQSGFNLALDGPWHELIRFNGETVAGGIELGRVIRELLRFTATRHPDFKGMVWVSMLAFTGPVFMRSLKRAPLGASGPENMKTIDHPTNIYNWYDEDQLPCLREGIGVINGVAVDLMRDLSDYSEMLLERIFRLSPMSMGGRDCLMHNHAALFHNAGFPESCDDLRQEILRLSDNGELARVGEMQEKTRIRSAVIGLSLIDELELPEQLDPVAAHHLDYRLHRARTLLETYGRTTENNPR